jgi:chitodextrinase
VLSSLQIMATQASNWLPLMQQQPSFQQQQQQHKFIGPVPQPSVVQYQADAEAAEQEAMQVFSSSTTSHAHTAVPMQSLICLLDQDAPAAAAAARAVSGLVRGNRDFANRVLQDDTVLTAAAWWLQGTGPAAEAAVHLLLTLAGLRLDMHFEAPTKKPG